MAARIFKEEGDVNLRLAELGAPKKLLLQAVRGAVAAFDSCTDNDPPGAPGYETYRVGTRDLRAALLPTGAWERDNGGLASILNAGTATRVVVLNTDQNTGDIMAKPTNRLEKGVLHERAIEGDSAWLDGMRPPELSTRIWYLCLHISGGKVTAELSRPSAIKDGFIIDWEERIMLVEPGEWDAMEFDDAGEDEGPDFAINVRRKK